MKSPVFIKTLITSLGLFVFLNPGQVSVQIVPQPWVSVGAKDGDVTYAVGAKALSLGVEVGTGADGATGVDVLKFIKLGVISPYRGIVELASIQKIRVLLFMVVSKEMRLNIFFLVLVIILCLVSVDS